MKALPAIVFSIVFFFVSPVFAEKEATVIVISMDGMRHDISKNSDLDAFERIATVGLKADASYSCVSIHDISWSCFIGNWGLS